MCLCKVDIEGKVLRNINIPLKDFKMEKLLNLGLGFGQLALFMSQAKSSACVWPGIM
jgi:hypothetical protein